MKALFALLSVLIVALIIWALNDTNDEQNNDPGSPKSAEETTSTKSDRSAKAGENPDEKTEPAGTGRTRVIGRSKPQGLTATWHPEKKGIFISPYNEEEIKAIGVVTGSKVTDSDGNELIAPPFEDSPVKLYPIGLSVPNRPGYALNPFTQNPVDIRGIPPGSLVMDPVDPAKADHKFRTPEISPDQSESSPK